MPGAPEVGKRLKTKPVNLKMAMLPRYIEGERETPMYTACCLLHLQQTAEKCDSLVKAVPEELRVESYPREKFQYSRNMVGA